MEHDTEKGVCSLGSFAAWPRRPPCLRSALFVALCLCSRRIDPTAEEESYDDVLCVLQLLNHLVTKDLVDYSDEQLGGKVPMGRAPHWTDVARIGDDGMGARRDGT